MAAIIDKHKLIDSINKPKILLGGGSNWAFGVDSKKLESVLGVPVVNMGLHAGLGLKFILNDLRYSLHKRDIVLLSIEYYLSEDGIYGLKMNASSYFKPAKDFFSNNYFDALRTLLNRNKDEFEKALFNKKVGPDPLAFVYTRSAFNGNGDVIGHLDKPSSRHLADRRILSYRYWDGINDLNDFYQYAMKKGARVFYLFPDYPQSEYRINKNVIEQLESDIRSDLKIEVLGRPSDFVFPDTCFFDTIYHLNKKGRKIRTEKLIKVIKGTSDLLQCLLSLKSDEQHDLQGCYLNNRKLGTAPALMVKTVNEGTVDITVKEKNIT
jgi:hypothetical protein